MSAPELRSQAIDVIRALKNKDAPRASNPYWSSPSGYNYGRWAARGFNIALGILESNVPGPGESASAYADRVTALIAAQRDEYRLDDEDEDGACSGALDAAYWAVRAVAPPGEPELATSAPEYAWEIWYRDMFDRETPLSVDVSGTRLETGLAELWARHLFETVRPNGALGFSRFHLKWDEGTVTVEGPWDGAIRLREYVFGARTRLESGYVNGADGPRLSCLARTHGRLTVAGRTSEDMLDAALAAADWDDLERRLTSL